MRDSVLAPRLPVGLAQESAEVSRARTTKAQTALHPRQRGVDGRVKHRCTVSYILVVTDSSAHTTPSCTATEAPPPNMSLTGGNPVGRRSDPQECLRSRGFRGDGWERGGSLLGANERTSDNAIDVKDKLDG